MRHTSHLGYKVRERQSEELQKNLNMKKVSSHSIEIEYKTYPVEYLPRPSRTSLVFLITKFHRMYGSPNSFLFFQPMFIWGVGGGVMYTKYANLV